MSLNRTLLPACLTVALAAALAGCVGVATTDEPGVAPGEVVEPSGADGDDRPAEVTVTHAQGETTVPVDPQRVITFDLATLDTLAALDVEVIGVPKSNLPGELARFDTPEVLDVGTLFEPDYEAVNAAEPDLIVVAGRSSEALPQLDRIAPTIDLSNDWSDFRASIEANARVIGQVFDKEDEIEELVAALDRDVDAARALAAEAGQALILMTAGGQATAYGPGSRFGFLHDELLVEPAIEDVEEATHGEAISFELVATTNPDWLFVVDRDAALGESGQAAAQVLDNELVAGTTAWQQDQVVYLDSVDWYVINGGIGTLSRMVAEVTAALER